MNKNIKPSPLIFNVVYEDFGEKRLAFNPEKIEIDSLIWANHENDSIVYYKICLKNIEKRPFVLKTKLVATKIPFLLRYSQQKNNEIILEVIQQFNTVWKDSLIFSKNGNYKEVYRIGYYHNGVNEASRLHPIYKNDTLDITNQ
ncbi:hypothetical protein [Chryseobacterium shigense]|uniref:Uncharacterized protein n=1 Tax=Chryseobacterium shigense TaxID=297244 RepID=A0A841MZT5_9FLAO|nr:hypothetical protein [Chryseobacterium shigense]MBB6370064.1 hypothetical protein [Chryseobacterium shigense]